MDALEQSNAPYWGAVEWLYEGNGTQAWSSAIKNTLAIGKIRYLCIYNWSGVKNNMNCITAIKEIIRK
jgi:hypothetical protein